MSTMLASSSPLQRASDKFRPMLKPKSPLRRHQRACTDVNVVSSPSASSVLSNLSPSTSSSLSDHTGDGAGMRTSASGSSLNSETTSSTRAAAAAQVQIGDMQLSLPLLAVTGVSLFVGSLVLRALYTFGTSLLRLFVLLVIIVAALAFSRFNEKQQDILLQQQQRKQRFASATEDGSVNFTTPTAAGHHNAAAYARGYSSGYGHTVYPGTLSSPLPSPPPPYVVEGRTRQLLAAHQRYPSYQ